MKKKIFIRVLLSALLLFSVVFSLTACRDEEFAASDILGEWCEDNGDGTHNPWSSYVFYSDGRATRYMKHETHGDINIDLKWNYENNKFYFQTVSEYETGTQNPNSYFTMSSDKTQITNKNSHVVYIKIS